MNIRTIFSSFFIFLLRIFCKPTKESIIPLNPQNILIIRQHNQFGDMLATIPLFRAVKECYPGCRITLVASPENYFAVNGNKYIDELFNFDKKRLWEGDYIKYFWHTLRKGYDAVIVPATVSISSTSCLMARIAGGKCVIGPASLDGKENKLSFLFNFPVELDWRKKPEMNVSQFCLDILSPLGIKTNNYTSHVTFTAEETKRALEFLNTFGESPKLAIGFHIGAGKPPNRWPVDNYITLINRLNQKYSFKFYFTGSSADSNEIEAVKKQFGSKAGYFINKTIPELASLISASSLFITNDTGVMHVAGAVDVPQISIFGPTNPNNWAPVGRNKFVMRNGADISSVSIDSVFDTACTILDGKGNK